MNERTQQLAEQATRQYSPTYYTQEWIQGFAELIVRECGEFCGQIDRDAMFIYFGVEDRAITKEMLDQTIAWCEQQLAEKKNDSC